MITQSGNNVNIKDGDCLSRKKNCLFVNNMQSGRVKNHDTKRISLEKDLDLSFVTFDGTQDYDQFSSVLVLGGDGTISEAVNNIHASGNLYYLPCGTVNDFGKIKREQNSPLIVGNVNGRRFCYVLATGTFTSIGYETKRKYKKRIGRIAYYLKALGELKIQRIPLKIKADEREFEGEYTLVMLLRSPRCFGFRFNRLYRDAPELYLLLIKSPKKGGVVGIVRLFIRFFRAFFIGFGAPHEGNVTFIRCRNVEINSQEKTTYCLDGEKYVGDEKLNVSAETTSIKLKILKKM